MLSEEIDVLVDLPQELFFLQSEEYFLEGILCHSALPSFLVMKLIGLLILNQIYREWYVGATRRYKCRNKEIV